VGGSDSLPQFGHFGGDEPIVKPLHERSGLIFIRPRNN